MHTIFFGCSMRGGHEAASREELKQIPEIIKKLGFSLASEHQVRAGIIEEENKLSKTEIHDRDYGWLISSQACIFETSNPSLGVGSEISDAIHLGKPVLILFKKGLGDKVSAYIQGKNGSQFVKTKVEYAEYGDIWQLEKTIKWFLESL